ncbi:hypothetical protein MIND_00563600 [Mycena indigotica]|uniref:Uncharacterized protein n=1 Tax=Mycena indigotica TaxID=2126181 RepID=A0A8H6SPB6_9AGAR|nr:uncharacterized protein MIND_00563600 [Mycena indigotica]KAF7303358.1 hypothetical protein MIND_00563600 [Mycena indigotica]
MMGDAEIIAELARLRIEIDATKADVRAIGYTLDSFSAHPLKAIEGIQAQLAEQAELQTEHYELQGRLEHPCSAVDVDARLGELGEWEKRLVIEREVWSEVLPLVMGSREAASAEATQKKTAKSPPTRGNVPGAVSPRLTVRTQTTRRDTPVQRPNSSRRPDPPSTASETSGLAASPAAVAVMGSSGTPQTPRKAKKVTTMPVVSSCAASIHSTALQRVVKSAPPTQSRSPTEKPLRGAQPESPRPPPDIAPAPKRIASVAALPPIEVVLPAAHFAWLDEPCENEEQATPGMRETPPTTIEMKVAVQTIPRPGDTPLRAPAANTSAVAPTPPVGAPATPVSPLRTLRFRKIHPVAPVSAGPSAAPANVNPNPAQSKTLSDEGLWYQFVDRKLKLVPLPDAYLRHRRLANEQTSQQRVRARRDARDAIQRRARADPPVRRCRPSHLEDAVPVPWDVLCAKAKPVPPTQHDRDRRDRYRPRPPGGDSLLGRIGPRVMARPPPDGERAAKRARRGSSLEPGEIDEGWESR